MEHSVPLLADAAGFDADRAAKARPRKPRARRNVAPAGLPAEAPALLGSTDVAPDFAAGAAPAADAAAPSDDVYHRIGQLTRTLHDALRELGYDKDLMRTREHLPDARDRLAYIARVTGEAAEKVLNAVDRARKLQEELAQRAQGLAARWQALAVYTGRQADRASPAGRQLVQETCEFFASIGGQADATQAILTDIMMAQDFHDLTGQVIRKVVALAQNVEEQLVRLLLESSPPEQRRKYEVEHLEGPVVNAEGRADVVTDQQQVDELLASLGF